MRNSTFVCASIVVTLSVLAGCTKAQEDYKQEYRCNSNLPDHIANMYFGRMYKEDAPLELRLKSDPLTGRRMASVRYGMSYTDAGVLTATWALDNPLRADESFPGMKLKEYLDLLKSRFGEPVCENVAYAITEKYDFDRHCVVTNERFTVYRTFIDDKTWIVITTEGDDDNVGVSFGALDGLGQKGSVLTVDVWCFPEKILDRCFVPKELDCILTVDSDGSVVGLFGKRMGMLYNVGASGSAEPFEIDVRNIPPRLGPCRCFVATDRHSKLYGCVLKFEETDGWGDVSNFDVVYRVLCRNIGNPVCYRNFKGVRSAVFVTDGAILTLTESRTHDLALTMTRNRLSSHLDERSILNYCQTQLERTMALWL